MLADAKQYRKTWEITPDLIGILNTDGVFETTNPAWLTVLGRSPQDIESKQFFDFLHPDDMERTTAAFEDILLGNPILNFKNRYQHLDGSYRWLSWNAVPEGDKFYCTARDISLAVATEARLMLQEEEAELREQFIAVLGHDLRNPLAAVYSGIRMVRRNPTAPNVGVVLESTESTIHRMSALIDDLMDFARSRLGSGISLHRVPDGTLREVLSNAVGELRIANPAHVIEEHYEFSEKINCDAPRLAQMLSNLIGNAIEHGSVEGPIVVRVEEQRTFFRLTVTNGGVPISAMALERLFQPFFRGEPGETHNGLGLGLFISSEIAKAHGGTLDVDSDENVTCFTFEMPLI